MGIRQPPQRYLASASQQRGQSRGSDQSMKSVQSATFSSPHLNGGRKSQNLNELSAVQQQKLPMTRPSTVNLTRKMVKVINGKIVPQEEHEVNRQSIQKTTALKQNQQTGRNTSAVDQRYGQVDDQSTCKAESTCSARSMAHEVDTFINQNEAYYKHVKGLCVCSKCNCGKHRCAYARNSHLKQPFNQTPAQSIYQINYVKKLGAKDVGFDYGMYDNLHGNAQPIDHQSINHKDYSKPDSSYGVPANFKPTQHYEANPAEIGRSHYKRNYLEWGCVPYQPVKGHSQRTTIDAMPFHGLTTYTKDFTQQNSPYVKAPNKNHTSTMVRSPIPFLGITTSQAFFKPYKAQERAVKYKAADELFTGAPSYNGQYNSLHNKDYINFSNLCPVDQDPALSAQSIKAK